MPGPWMIRDYPNSAKQPPRGAAQHTQWQAWGPSTWQVAASHQEFIHRTRGLTAFADRPYHQTLAATDVAGGKDLGHVGGITAGEFGRGFGIATGVLLDTEGFQHRSHRVDKTHGQQDQVSLIGFLGTWNLDHL